MSEKLQIGPAWAAVLVAVIIPTLGGVWYFASSQARTETTVSTLDKRTEKIEAKLDAIAIRLQVAEPSKMAPSIIERAHAAYDCPDDKQTVRFVAPNPLP